MKPAILVVDDLDELRLLIRLTLAPLGDVTSVDNAAAALAEVQRAPPELIVLDVRLGQGADGLDVCRQLKSSPLTSRIRIVLLSACGQQSDVEAGLAAGADRYVVKPFSPDHLYSVVAGLLK